ncbi:hypothetical protein FQN57_002705 [Myotisia sp. PD_48]|nr:hypothetical protein FQN57_002705 [Myotisia sp. PD_48]
MCSGIECGVCKKTTWRGCGLHVVRVFSNIDKAEWCTCIPKTKIDDNEYPPKVGEGKQPEPEQSSASASS